MIFRCVISAPFVVFCKSECPLHPLKPCKNSAETVHLLWDKWKMMIFDPWLGGGLSDHEGKFDTRKEECPLVWEVLRGVGILYMSLATFSMEVAIFWDEVDSFSIKVAILGKKFLLFYMASFRTFRITFHTFRTTPWCCLRSLAAAFLHKAWPWQRKRHSDG